MSRGVARRRGFRLGREGLTRVGRRCGARSCDLVVAGDGLARSALTHGVGQGERGDHREHENAADGRRPCELRRRRRIVRRDVGPLLEGADRGRGPCGVVVVQVLVRAVVDVAGFAFVFKIFERPQQEVALRFEPLAIELVAHSPSPASSSASARWRCRSTTSASAAVAANRGDRLERRSANAMPAAPSTIAMTGTPHTITPRPPFEGVSNTCSP